MSDKTADQSGLDQHLQTLNALNLTDPQIHQSRVPGFLLLYIHPATLEEECFVFCLDLV